MRSMTRKRHTPEEIMTKLREPDEALTQGKTVEDVAKSVGVSLMTLHRWRTDYGFTDRVTSLQRSQTTQFDQLKNQPP